MLNHRLVMYNYVKGVDSVQDDKEFAFRKLFGRQLKTIRQKYDMTREELAVHLEISWQAVAHLENGERGVKGEVIRALSNLFQVSADYFIRPDLDENDLTRCTVHLRTMESEWLDPMEDVIVATKKGFMMNKRKMLALMDSDRYPKGPADKSVGNSGEGDKHEPSIYNGTELNWQK